MRKYTLLLLILISWNIAFANYEQLTRPGKDYALFFVNDDYSENKVFDNLEYPIKDADSIAWELENMFDFEVVIYKNFSKPQIISKLEQWQRRKFLADAQLFIFFSGHGTIWEAANTGYFVPRSKDSDFSQYISLNILGNLITKINCNHILLSIDACYSGMIGKEMVFRAKSGWIKRPGEEEHAQKSLIDKQMQNRSRLLITSGLEKTPDDSDFSSKILNGLRNAYANGDGLLTYRDLLAILDRIQPTPYYGELPGHEGGGFVFIEKQEAYRFQLPTIDVEQEPTAKSGNKND